jgi:DNA primase
MEAILAFVPEEERLQYSAMTGQSLYYLGDTDLKHKVLAIVEEQGAEQASYALKLLQSEGELRIASTGKDPATGRMVTQDYRVEGPVMIILTTTAIDIDEELLNRCIVLTVDESRAQTRRIHELQRQARTLEGLERRLQKEKTLRVHQNAQRLLRPLRVINPYAAQLTFLDDRTRTRRDHEKYLTLIDTVTLLHQYQRPLKERGGQAYVEATLSDIEIANRLAAEALGRSLDELPPQTRALLMRIEAMVKSQCENQKIARSDYRFSRRDVRSCSGWSDFQVRV